MKYTYHAYTEDKKVKRGTIDADSPKIAEENLLHQGFQRILNLQDTREKNTLKRRISINLFSVKDIDVLNFSRELASLLNAGISIITALELLEKETSKNSMRLVIKNIISDLHAGKPFSEAMSKYPKVFSTTYHAIIKTSEQTGELVNGLRHMTEHLEKQENIKKRIRRALTYPILVIIVAMGVSALLVTAVLPPIVGMFESLGTELPLITKLFVAVAEFLVNNKFYLLAAFFAIPVTIIVYMCFPSGKYNFDKFLLKIPQIGQLVIKINLLFFCRASSTLLRAGISISNVLTTCGPTIGNRRMRTAITDGEKGLLKGHPFSRAMEETGLFPASSIEALVVGERTGELEATLEKLAGNFERTSQEKVDNLVSIIEPSITIGIGLVVGILAVSVIVPIYSLSGSLP